MDVIRFNYGAFSWNMFPRYSGRISYFWKKVTSRLPTFRGCVSYVINLGMETLFWKDQWLNGRTPMYLWSDEFNRSRYPNGTVHDLEYLLYKSPFSEVEDVHLIRDRVSLPARDSGDKNGGGLLVMVPLWSNPSIAS